MEEEVALNPATSPVPTVSPTYKIERPVTMDFMKALEKVLNGGKITKLEWKNSRIYGFLSPTTNHLSLHKEDGKDYDWIVNDGDLNGTDWIYISNPIV